MRKSRAAMVVGIALVVVPALVVVGVLSFAAPCGVHDDGTVSPCFSAGRAVLAVGAAALVAGVVRLLMRGPKVVVLLDALLAVLGVVVALLPGTLMPLCMMETMRCHTVMRPVMGIFGVALAVLAAADVVLARRALAAADVESAVATTR